MENDIKLEDEVKCKYTGIKGVILSRTEFVNGCVQFGIHQKYDPLKGPEQIGEINIDSQSLVIVKKGPRHKKIIKEKKEFTGGPMKVMRRRM